MSKDPKMTPAGPQYPGRLAAGPRPRIPFETFKGAICKGDEAFGSACGTCEKCLWIRAHKLAAQQPAPPALAENPILRLCLIVYSFRKDPAGFMKEIERAIENLLDGNSTGSLDMTIQRMPFAEADKSFRSELQTLINRFSMENRSDTPDFVLADYLTRALQSFDQAVRDREAWYGRDCRAANRRAVLDPRKMCPPGSEPLA